MAVDRIVRKDDLGGSGEATTVTFGVDGVNYEIDLNKVNRKSFDSALGKFIMAARRTGVNTAQIGKVSHSSEIRQWATKNGVKLNARGRIPATVQQAYTSANSAEGAE